jgi:uncharacterized protein (TIGR03083 family)
MTAPAPTTNQHQASSIWPLVHAERAAVAEDLAALDDAQWAHPSLCERWVIEDVVAHLTAAASIGPVRWFASVLRARFDFDLHNDRRLAEYRGATPAETLERFRRIVTSTTSALGPTAAWLGEVVVHAQDTRRPLGLVRMPRWERSPRSPVSMSAETSRWPAGPLWRACESRRPTVRSPTGPFATGTGPLVSGTTLALTMAMAGRRAYCDDLSGPGVSILRACCSSG